MVPRREPERARYTDLPDLDVALQGLSCRHRLVRNVRHGEHEILQPLLDRLETLLEPQQRFIGAIGLGHEPRDVFTLGFGLPDALGELVSRGLQILRTNLDLLTLLLDGPECRNIERERACREQPGGRIDIVAEQLRIEHVYYFLFFLPGLRLRKWVSFSAIFASSPRSVGSYHLTAGMPSGK